jgi:hypothetical protein
MAKPLLTPLQSQYYAWLLTRRMAGDTVESLGPTLVDSQVDLNPHQVEAALFACRNPLSKGVILADEVGLGKTIEAGLVISQRWAERKRKILIIVPANLRKQWHQELQDKFNLVATVLEAKSYNALRKEGVTNPFNQPGPIICSYQFVRSKADEVGRIQWDLAVIDEAHRLRNVYKPGNVIARTIKDALEHVEHKVFLTATPLQNSLLELYGLVSMIDDRVFGDLESFRSQFSQLNRQLEGFTYEPSETQWWRHGHSSERDFIYITTQNLSADQLQALADDIGEDNSLMVCCSAFHGVSAAKAAERWPNLTIKKIPKMVLARCEWGHDDYSLNVANLPMAEPEPTSPPPASKRGRGKKTSPAQATLFDGAVEGDT